MIQLPPATERLFKVIERNHRIVERDYERHGWPSYLAKVDLDDALDCWRQGPPNALFEINAKECLCRLKAKGLIEIQQTSTFKRVRPATNH